MSWFVDAASSPTSCTRPSHALSVLEVVSTCSFWGPGKVQSAPMFCGTRRCGWLHGCIKSFNPVFPLNSFTGPISLCIILGKEPGFCATNQSFNDSETPTKHCNKQKGRWKSKGLHSQTLTWKSHRIDGFCKWVGCLHSSFPIKLFKIPT